MNPRPAPKRAVLKLSGEVLGGTEGPLDAGALSFYASEIADAMREGWALGIVMGGGNVARGTALPHVPRVAGHTIGMLATLINGVALREVLLEAGVAAELQSAIPCAGVAEPIDPWAGRAALDAGKALLLAGGTGSPFVTTDTAAVIRALALEAQLVVKGSKVDGVYEADPHVEPSARVLPELSYEVYLQRGLGVMDMAAVAIAADHALPLVVYRADRPGGLLAALRGQAGSRIG